MQVFTVHSRAAEASPLLLPEGFSWLALLLGPLWLLVHRLWLPALGFLVLSVALGLVSPWFSLAVQLLFGFEAQDIRRWALARQGWQTVGLVAAPNAEAATQRLLDAAA